MTKPPDSGDNLKERQSRLNQSITGGTSVRSRSNSTKERSSNARGRLQQATGAQTRSQSAKSSTAGTSAGTDPLSALRRFQREQVIEQKRAVSHVSTSTPIGSPNSKSIGDVSKDELQGIGDDATSTFISTPIAASAATALISNPAALDPIEDHCSTDELNTFLDLIATHIHHYGTNMVLDNNWKSNFNAKYIAISMRVL